MSFVVADTIAAMASARGPGARSIIRLSGPGVADCLRRCFVANSPWDALTAPAVTGGTMRLATIDADLPCDLYFWPTNRSYTKQPSAELHLLGSVPLAEAALDALCETGARLARPGEFTMRAFLAGRIDLPQAEAVLGVIDASNQRALRRAIKQLAGGLSDPLARLRNQLLNLLADVEAGLDFVEEDIEFVSQQDIIARLVEATEMTNSMLATMQGRATTASSPKAVLLGLPNVGKSSLFNRLCNRQRAIVSEKSGTTRDYVEGSLRSLGDTDTTDCTIVDTAGVIAGGTDIAPGSTQHVTAEQWRDAELLVVCLDASRPITVDDHRLLIDTQEATRLIVWTKTDLVANEPFSTRSALPTLPELPTQNAVRVSSLTGQGIVPLIGAIHDKIGAAEDEETQVVQSTAQRCKASLEATRASFQSALALAREAAGDELLAAELRIGLDHLGQIVGAVYTDDVLDRIFSRFCIGK